jgi:hypothetical protein
MDLLERRGGWDMRNATLTITLFLLIVSAAPVSGQMQVGILGGVNFAKYDADEPAEHTSRIGLVLGGVAEFALNERFGLRLEPVLIQKGGTGEDASVQEKATLEQAMFELPVLLTLGWGETTRPYLLAGPTLAAVVTSRIEGEMQGIPMEGDLKEVTETFELGMAVGAGVAHSLGRVSAFVEARYLRGFSNMQKGGDALFTTGPFSTTVTFDKEDNEYHLRGIQLLAGLTIPVG